MILDNAESRKQKAEDMDIPTMLMNLGNLTIQEPPPMYMNNELVNALFHDNLDIYDNKENDKVVLELGVPNVYCCKYFDDEDFIYARMKITNVEINFDLNVINYITANSIILDFSENTLDTRKIYAKILYVYQFVNTYFTSLTNMRPLDRIKHIPKDLLIWVDNLVNTIRYILDKDLFNYQPKKTNIEEEYFKELIYGLNLTVCHLKMLTNHYRIRNIPIYNMEEKHIKKLFRVLNNMCVITIFLRNVL